MSYLFHTYREIPEKMQHRPNKCKEACSYSGFTYFCMPLFWQVRMVNLSSDLEAEVFDVLCRYISCQSYCCWEGAKAKSRGEWEVRGQVMTFTVTVVYQVFLLSFCRIYCFFLQGMLSARICKSLVEDSVVCVCVFDWTDCVFPLWCVCAVMRTFAGAAALSAGAPESASVCCSLERCKHRLFTSSHIQSLCTLPSPVLFSLYLSSVCSSRRLKEVKLTHWKKLLTSAKRWEWV